MYKKRVNIPKSKIMSINRYFEDGKNYREISELTGISKGTCSRIIKGKYSEKALAPVCPSCGVVHSKVCKPSFEERLEASGLPVYEQYAIHSIFERLKTLSFN